MRTPVVFSPATRLRGTLSRQTFGARCGSSERPKLSAGELFQEQKTGTVTELMDEFDHSIFIFMEMGSLYFVQGECLNLAGSTGTLEKMCFNRLGCCVSKYDNIDCC